MIVIYFEPDIGHKSWYLTGPDRKHIQEIWEQIEAMNWEFGYDD